MAKIRKIRKSAKILVLAVIVVLVISVVYSSLFKPITISDDVSVKIADGSSSGAISSLLYDAGLTRNSSIFKFYAMEHKIDSELRAGTYKFTAGRWSLADISKILLNGTDADSVKVTIPEGLTVSETADIFVKAGLVEKEAFMNYAQNGDFPYDYLPTAGTANRLEGFLFPNTYMVEKDWTEKKIIDMLLAEFDEIWNEKYQQKANELDKSVKEVVTMASLVEKEAKVADERPLIASVFYNRLKISMKLQSCATVQFILGKAKYPLLYSDLKIDSPYNTYIYYGLPPGPIASPGEASLTAALYPSSSNYLYFRAQKDGSHRFSLTLKEHDTPQPNDQ